MGHSKQFYPQKKEERKVLYKHFFPTSTKSNSKSNPISPTTLAHIKHGGSYVHTHRHANKINKSNIVFIHIFKLQNTLLLKIHQFPGHQHSPSHMQTHILNPPPSGLAISSLSCQSFFSKGKTDLTLFISKFSKKQSSHSNFQHSSSKQQTPMQLCFKHNFILVSFFYTMDTLDTPSILQ